MLLIIPIAKPDVDDLETLAECLARTGPYHEDGAMLLLTPEVTAIEEAMANVYRIADLFGGIGEKGRATIEMTSNDLEGKQPFDRNLQFQFAVNAVSGMELKDPFMWFLPKTVPLQAGWTSTITHGYRNSNAPFYGHEMPNYEIRENVKKGNQRYLYLNGKKLAAVGVYPVSYVYGIGPNGSKRGLWKAPNLIFPFDSFCQNEHRPVCNSRHIRCFPETANWRFDGDTLVCDDAAPPEFKELSNAGQHDLTGCVLVSGCVDGSLAALLLGAQSETTSPVQGEPARAGSAAPPILRPASEGPVVGEKVTHGHTLSAGGQERESGHQGAAQISDSFKERLRARWVELYGLDDGFEESFEKAETWIEAKMFDPGEPEVIPLPKKKKAKGKEAALV